MTRPAEPASSLPRWSATSASMRGPTRAYKRAKTGWWTGLCWPCGHGHPSDLLDDGGQLTVWRYRRTARGAKTAVMAADQARASATWPVTVWPGGRAPWPRSRPRRALVVAVTGWWAANACSHPGMVWVGTNIELVDSSGNAPVKLAAWTASGVRTTRPRAAMAHEQASR